LSDLMFLFLLLASRCLRCRGDGYKTCSVCHDPSGLHCFCLFMTCFRKNNISDFIPDRQPDFPDKKFEKVSGDPFFIDENVLVKQPFPFYQLHPETSNSQNRLLRFYALKLIMTLKIFSWKMSEISGLMLPDKSALNKVF
ncbi:hypothetical protein GOODEAATRI_028704, partial [Goodea atripinnis]